MKIGIGHAIRSIYLDPVVHPATPPPAVLDNANCTALKFQNAKSFVISPRLVGVNVGAHLAVHRLDRGTPEEPVAESNPVATEIHERAAAAAIYIPEPWSMWSKMLFALFHEMDFAERAIIRHFLCLKVFGGEEKFLGVQQQDTCLPGDMNHLLAFLDRHSQWFFTYHVLARLGAVGSHLCM